MPEQLHALRTNNLEICFSREQGALCRLRDLDSDASWIANGGSRSDQPSLDVRLAGGWIGERRKPEFGQVEHERRDGAESIAVSVALGPLILRDIYTIRGCRLARRVELHNRGTDELQITGVRMIVPGVAIGNPEHCLFEAPGTAVRPRLPLSVAAAQRPGQSPSEDFAAAARARWGLAMESAPDCSPGLMAVHNQTDGFALLCWYYSEIEEALPLVWGSEQAVSLVHESSLAGWLAPGDTLTCGTQHILLYPGTWTEALAEYRRTFRETGVVPPLYGSAPGWCSEAGIYEVHPARFGGLRGLTAALPRIRELGVDTLYLLPVWSYDNPQRRLWDECWSSSGSPYAILDFESIETTLGSEEDLGRLVSEAHRLGLRVLLDFVCQGCSRDSRYVEEHPEWLCRDEGGEPVSSHGWNDTLSLDWANPEYQAYMLDWSLQLMRACGFDGYRVDAPLAKEANWDRSIPYHASTTNLGVLRLLEKLQTAIKKQNPEAVLLCELFGPVFTKSHDLCYDYLACAQTYQLLQQRLTAAEWSTWIGDHRLSLPEGALRVCFVETHDTREFHPPAYGWRGSQLSRAGLAALILAGFVPMIWSGQEKGQEEFYGRLLRARSASRALVHGEVLLNRVSCSNPWVVSILRRSQRQLVWGLVSLWPEKTDFLFSLPWQELGLEAKGDYMLSDLISGRSWSEYGSERWTGETLGELRFTPEPFVPYFFDVGPG